MAQQAFLVPTSGIIAPRQFKAMAQQVHNKLDAATNNQREAGMLWYPTAHDHARAIGQLARDTYGASLDQMPDHVRGAGMLSALSPQTEWERNLKDAYELAAGTRPGNLGPSIANATSIAQGEHPDQVFRRSPREKNPHRGPHKTYNFYHNIEEPDDPRFLTVDRHAAAIVHGRQFVPKGQVDTSGVPRIKDAELADDRRYNATAAIYHHVAQARGLHPNVAQAISWLVHTERDL